MDPNAAHARLIYLSFASLAQRDLLGAYALEWETLQEALRSGEAANDAEVAVALCDNHGRRLAKIPCVRALCARTLELDELDRTLQPKGGENDT